MKVETCRGRMGQATLEYLLILAAVIAAIALASTGFRTQVDKTFKSSETAVTSAGGKLKAGLQ